MVRLDLLPIRRGPSGVGRLRGPVLRHEGVLALLDLQSRFKLTILSYLDLEDPHQ